MCRMQDTLGMSALEMDVASVEGPRKKSQPCMSCCEDVIATLLLQMGKARERKASHPWSMHLPLSCGSG